MSKAASALVLAAALLAGCGGLPSGSGSGSSTTVATGEPAPKPDLELERRVTEFNEMVLATEPEWRFSAEETVKHFIAGDAAYAVVVDEDKGTATGTSPSLEDDSVRHERYELVLLMSDATGWMIRSATRTYKCQPNRGHQEFSAELCL